MRRSYEDHRRPSPRRPTASVREAAVLVRHFMSATMTIPPTISIRVLPSRRQLEVVEAICTLTASQPASHNIGARSPRERTPICFRSLIKTIMLASHGCKPTRRQSEAARHKAHSSASANLPAPSFNPAHMGKRKSIGSYRCGLVTLQFLLRYRGLSPIKRTRLVFEHDQTHIRSPFATAAPISRLRRARLRRTRPFFKSAVQAIPDFGSSTWIRQDFFGPGRLRNSAVRIVRRS